MTTEEARTKQECDTTLFLETIFCDAEPSAMTQLTYFQRLERALESLARVRVPGGMNAVHLIYVSVDKQQWINRLHQLVAHWAPEAHIVTRIVRYAHPSDGYEQLTQAHPDVVKGPNKQNPLRKRLFGAAVGAVPEHHTILRMTLDDDDLWLPWQLEELARAVSEAQGRWPGRALGIGLRQCLLAYVSGDGVKVEHVAMNRMLTGNKVFVFPPEHRDLVLSNSPWGIPELMTENYRDSFRRIGFELAIVENHRPGFVYMRRGKNLSGQNKTGFVTATLGTWPAVEEKSLVQRCVSELAGVVDHGPVRFGIDPPQYRINVRRNGGTVFYSSNVQEVHGTTVRCAFHLLQGSTVVAKTGYGRLTTGAFTDAPPQSRVKLYVKMPDGARESKVSHVV